MRKTEAKRGKLLTMKIREDEEQLVLDWINAQSVHGDSLRYLIQKEIAENGIRDLQQYVPRSRDIESIRNQLLGVNSSKFVSVPIEVNRVVSLPVDNEIQDTINQNNDSAALNELKENKPEVITSTSRNNTRRAAKTYDQNVISTYQS